MSKKIAMISTYCDTQEKLDILLNNIKKIKSLGIDVIGIGPNHLIMPDEVIKEFSFFFYTKENPVLNYPIRQYTHWYSFFTNTGKKITFHRGVGDYGWAALYQTKKISEIALTFDYDIFFHLIYDLEITDEVLNKFESSDINVVYPRVDPHDPTLIWYSCLHFMVLNREILKNIVNEIDYDLYIKTNGIAETHVEQWIKKFNVKSGDLVVKDLIHYWTGYDFFDYKIHKDFKFFISKNPEETVWNQENNSYDVIQSGNLRMVFYDLKTEIKEISIIVNNEEHVINPISWDVCEIPIQSSKINTINIKWDNLEMDLTELYSKISFNQIQYDSVYV